MGAREYYDYRRAIYGDITHKAILVDAAGTLLAPTEPMAQVYRTLGEKYGVKYSEDEILMRYRQAYSQPWGRSRLRYVDDGRPFWQHIVSSSTSCSDLQYFEELYHYYTTEKAWQLIDPDAKYVFEALRRAGVRTAVVSNFDTRLRPLLQALNCDHWFDAVAVSAEVAAEKPNPTIFLKACELLDVKPEETVHIGDDRRNDLWGARDAGCDAWLWGSDVHSFKEDLEVESSIYVHIMVSHLVGRWHEMDVPHAIQMALMILELGSLRIRCSCGKFLLCSGPRRRFFFATSTAFRPTTESLLLGRSYYCSFCVLTVILKKLRDDERIHVPVATAHTGRGRHNTIMVSYARMGRRRADACCLKQCKQCMTVEIWQ